MTRGSVALCLLVTAAGCSLLNEPDRDKLEPADAGMDSPMDAPMDAPTDGGMDADAGDGSMCTSFESDCSDGEDNDCDGLTDCADFDCAAAEECCGEATGDPVLDERWSSGFGRWVTFPSDAQKPRLSDNQIDDFRETTALRSGDCIPMLLGLDIEATLIPEGGADSFAAITLTPSEGTRADGRFLEDIAVQLTGDGQLTVRRGPPEEIHYAREEAIGLSKTVDLEISVTPGLDGNRPALFATIVAFVDGEPETLVDRQFVTDQSTAIDSAMDCTRIPGLFLGIEGSGEGVNVGRIKATARRCVNPRQFGTPEDADDILTPARVTDTMGGTPDEYASGSFGAPALVHTCTEEACWMPPTEEQEWNLLFEATNVERLVFTHVGYSIGHAEATVWDGNWLSSGSDAPKIGHDPPTCLSEAPDGGVDPCADARSYREPTAHPFVITEGGVIGERPLVGAYARELESAIEMGTRDVFGIHAVKLDSNRDQCLVPSPASCEDPSAGDTPTVEPSDTEGECISLRHPELVPAQRPSTGGGELTFYEFWLLFTCERGGGVSDIRAVRVDDRDGFTVEATPQVVLEPGIGDFASKAVLGPEAVIDFGAEGDTPVMRLWFVGKDGSNRRTIGLAQTELARDAEDDPLPDLVPFPANPVLRMEDDVLGCTGECDLVGFDVVSRADNPPAGEREDTPLTLRFLVARRVNDGSGVGHEMVPLEQSWKPR